MRRSCASTPSASPRRSATPFEGGRVVATLTPRGKSPRSGRRGVRRRRPTSHYLLARWTRKPDANVGIATGSVSGLVVVDIDGPLGEEERARFLDGRSEPTTTTARSGRLDGGRHLLFSLPPELVGAVSLQGGSGVIGERLIFSPMATTSSPHPRSTRAAVATGR